MSFTDIFIRRPVLALVVSLLILLIGLRAMLGLPIRQFPKLSNTTITITTIYPGASPDLMQGFIATPMAQAVATAEGIDYLISNSVQGTSTITAYIRLDFDPDQALTEVMAKVQQVKYLLPTGAQDPIITKATGQTTAVMYIGFSSNELSSAAISDYLTRVVQPLLVTVPGVASADILGGQVFAMRLWLDPVRMAARGITASDAFLSGRTMIMAGHEILKFVCYPISKQPDASGKHRINWVAERHMPPTYQWRREDYNRTAKLEEFLPWFESWRFEWLDVPALIRNCPHAYEYPLVDRDPLSCWTFGRVTLLGDAAHPMYPIGSNGASQAILDARVLTREILAHGETHEALAAYEAERRPATTDLVMLNRRNGPEQVMQLVEERAPEGFNVVTDVLSRQELEDIAANYKRVAGFQVEALNAKPPIVAVPAAG